MVDLLSKHRNARRNFFRRLRNFRQDLSGIAAVEFAMLLPIMVTLYLGTVEVTQGVAVDRKSGITARTVADLVSQSTSVTNADMSNIMAASFAVMAPYPTDTLKIVVSAVDIDANGVAKIAWSDAVNASAHSVNSVVSIPAALKVPNTQLIWGETTYVYTPLIGYVVTGAINLASQNFVRPRQSSTISRVP